MKKRYVLSTVIVAVLILTVTAWFIYNEFNSLQTRVAELQAQNGELQSQNSYLQKRIGQLLEQFGENYSSPVKIVAFVWEGGFYPVVGVTLYHPVNVTIRNYAAVNVSGLSLTVRLINNYNGAQIGTSGGANIDLLQAGETREIETGAYSNLGTSLANAACVVTLKSGNTVLDELTQIIG